MPEKLSHEADPKNVPDVVYVSPMELKPNRVAMGLLIGAIILVIGIGGAYFITNFVLTDTVPVAPVETKKASPSATVATPSAQKDETANWKNYSNAQYKFSLSYPAKYRIVEDSDGEIYSVSLEDGADSVRFVVNAPGMGLMGFKLENILVDEVNSIKASSKEGDPTAIYVFPEDKNLAIFLVSTEVSIPLSEDSIKTFDTILSTFRFLN